MNQKRTVLFYLGLSIIGGIILLAPSFFGSWDIKNIVFFDYLLVAVIFISGCLLGISFAIKPNWIKRAIETRKGNEKANPTENKRIARLGHHPDCKEFEDHIIKVKKRTLCSGCTGLAIGSVVSIILIIVYLIIQPKFQSNIKIFLFIMGFTFICVNYLNVVSSIKNSILHLISNIFLVIGFFLIVIFTLEITGNSTLAILAVVFSFLWLDTRIQISKWRHKTTCKVCLKSCKAYGI